MSENITNTGAAENAGAAQNQTTQAVAPKTVAGQKHVSPPGRHSQQSHVRATARAAALGLTTARELYEHDRAEALAKLQKGADGKLAQQKNEQDRRSGAGADKA